MKKIKCRVVFKFKKEIVVKKVDCITMDNLLSVQGVKIININLATGFLDSKNKMIYEHDIVRIDGYPENGDDEDSEVLFFVEYLDDYAKFVLSPFQKDDFNAPLIGIEECSHPFDRFDKEDFRIIGNIYKNHELLGLELKELKKLKIIN